MGVLSSSKRSRTRRRAQEGPSRCIAYLVVWIVALSRSSDAFLPLQSCPRQRSPLLWDTSATLYSNTTISLSATSDDDVARPTPNGGFSHTSASRAKISAANKGKVPWNKGKQRSDEVRARIAAGVRAKNRERFLQKLQEQGLTEEEYEAQKKEERRRKDAARAARRTANGGYRPTEETKQKISKILKQKYANGEVKPRVVDPSKVRRGFTHSEETRRKISESLRKRWADDETYRDNMVKKASELAGNEDVRRKISNSLKKKWQDPEFRAEMMSKISTRSKPTGGIQGPSHRERISEAMKAKWQDEEYRAKTMASIAKRQAEAAKNRPPRPPRVAKPRPPPMAPAPAPVRNEEPPPVAATAPAEEDTKNVYMVQPKPVKAKPATPLAAKAVTKRRRAASSSPKASTKPATTPRKTTAKAAAKAATPKPKATAKKPPATTAAATTTVDEPLPSPELLKKNGDKSRLREERRDLYDLLYGDERSLADENLDAFDPYGLQDF